MYQYIIIVVCVISAYGLFAIKEKASILKYQFEEVSKQVTKEQDMIHILKAEFAYLTSPSRLKKLAINYLQLDNIKTLQMTKDPLIPGESLAKVEIRNLNLVTTKHSIKWRYKKAPSKYLRTVSSR